MRTTKWESTSRNQTIERGRLIGLKLQAGTKIALIGTLGSGKTTFVKGLGLGLGVTDEREVKSPTFVIFHIYKGRIPLYHFDLYRFHESTNIEDIGLDEFIDDPNAISVVEWADRIPRISKQADIVIELSKRGETGRTIRMKERGR
ncbi:MAG: tRNA (adenosine(37)-N6)-threonylcarbamoyltransferase complex ATPase subunit type 1 TsaE [Omnitrophica bacterium RIFCSPHIGHO2_02_FULL_46_11]|nr:MAG: tRNA (adenosine(37)-N6)-threonylcarbamoyltransferase complex ATPase subunit type 1 TsaE [Omnitrophica bacterium RIFCSPHIGHO2_02_FULL_46_11]OGW86175.1 MAG: tRNA (adenosine(37)-N6)-threonylcarbamoyltransferase complex ATPase subunit type 1 TsaE [Omnitrophica bacterium RIFCSPLOWO2_01_FULL_45_10b]